VPLLEVPLPEVPVLEVLLLDPLLEVPLLEPLWAGVKGMVCRYVRVQPHRWHTPEVSPRNGKASVVIS